MAVKINSNVTIKKGVFQRSKNMRGFFKILKSNPIYSHNVVLDIGKSYLIRSLAGEFGSVPAVIKYCGIGRNKYPDGSAVQPSSTKLQSLSDPNPYYTSIINYKLGQNVDMDVATSVKFTIFIIGTPEMFDHFEMGSTTLSIGEIGLFFDGTDSTDPNWGVGPGGKTPYTIFARDNIVEAEGAPLILNRSAEPGVYQSWEITWTVDMV